MRATLESHEVGDEIVIRLAGRIESIMAASGEVRVRLATGELLGLTPEQLNSAVEAERARDLLLGHLLTGEPLGEGECDLIVAADLCGRDCFDHTGGGCFRHVLLQDDEQE